MLQRKISFAIVDFAKTDHTSEHIWAIGRQAALIRRGRLEDVPPSSWGGGGAGTAALLDRGGLRKVAVGREARVIETASLLDQIC